MLIRLLASQLQCSVILIPSDTAPIFKSGRSFQQHRWYTISMPAGLTLSNNTISGTPSEVGLNTIQVKANSSQEQTKDLEI